MNSLFFESALHLAAAGAGAHIFSVGDLALHIGQVFAGDEVLQDVWLRGEVCNLSRSTAGHYYFSLKDGTAQLRCVLFRGNAMRSPSLPESGQALVAHGEVRFYERQGSVELLVDMLFPEGMGLAQMQMEALVRRLEAEGLFDPARKRPLPDYPRRIGIVSSDGGAVIHDLLTVLARRYPLGEVIFLPTPVQGATAPPALVAALRRLNTWQGPDGAGVDLIVLARGGGSAEDLAAFNDEGLVRAVFGSRVPVVSAVGHETDVTLTDLVADLRAPTPSAAAEMISPDLSGAKQDLAALRLRASQAVQAVLSQARSQTRASRGALAAHAGHYLSLAREQLAGRRAQLAALSPEATLSRGYAIVEAGGHVVDDAGTVQPGENLAVRLHRGRLAATVTEVHPA